MAEKTVTAAVWKVRHLLFAIAGYEVRSFNDNHGAFADAGLIGVGRVAVMFEIIAVLTMMANS